MSDRDLIQHTVRLEQAVRHIAAVQDVELLRFAGLYDLAGRVAALLEP